MKLWAGCSRKILWDVAVVVVCFVAGSRSFAKNTTVTVRSDGDKVSWSLSSWCPSIVKRETDRDRECTLVTRKKNE